MDSGWGEAMGWVLGCGGLAVGALVWWRRRRRVATAPAAASPDPTDLPGSDWHEIAARYHHSRVEALRGWLGDDHDLVRRAPPGAPPPNAGPADDSRSQRRTACPVMRVDLPLPMHHDRPL